MTGKEISLIYPPLKCVPEPAHSALCASRKPPEKDIRGYIPTLVWRDGRQFVIWESPKPFSPATSSIL